MTDDVTRESFQKVWNERVSDDWQVVMDRVSIGGFDACWWWKGALTSGNYGSVTLGGKTYRAHRVVYEHYRGTIPDGHLLHHTCEERLCVNPKHLMPVTPAEHQRLHDYVAGRVTAERLGSATHCKRGHEFTPENTITTSTGRRECRTCHKASTAASGRRRTERLRREREAG